MCKRLICLISFIVMLALAGNATAQIDPSDTRTLVGAYYVDSEAISQVQLDPGIEYIIATELKQNLDNVYDCSATWSPDINWIVGEATTYGGSTTLPDTVTAFTIHRPMPYCYIGPNFEYVIPEPATIGLVTLAGLGLIRRRTLSR